MGCTLWVSGSGASGGDVGAGGEAGSESDWRLSESVS